MPWLQLRFTVPRADAEAVSTALEEAGAHAVTLQSAGSDALFDQIDESPTLWESTSITALFDANRDAAAVIDALARTLTPQRVPPYTAQRLDDQDWNRLWMDRFRPLYFGGRLWVVPSWHKPPDPAAVNIVLDPGMAFGTGTHPTTALCLRWLGSADVRGKRVIDYGCGSGILAIAAAKLGAQRVFAVDIDPQCLEVTRENAERNDASNQIAISAPDDCPAQHVDILLANILSGPLLALPARFADLVRPGGHIVLSGLLAPQAEECLTAYDALFAMDAPRIDGDWAMLHGTRR